MNLFGKEPQEQAMQKLMHDLNNATTDVNFHHSRISDWLSKNVKQCNENGISLSPIYVALEYLKSRNRDIQNAQDAYYEKFKNDFKIDNK